MICGHPSWLVECGLVVYPSQLWVFNTFRAILTFELSWSICSVSVCQLSPICFWTTQDMCGQYEAEYCSIFRVCHIFEIMLKIQPNSQTPSRYTWIPYVVMWLWDRLIFGTLVELASNCLVLTSDALLLAFTWYKTIDTHRTAMELGIKMPLTTLLLHDGMDMDLQLHHSIPL